MKALVLEVGLYQSFVAKAAEERHDFATYESKGVRG
jgi:hypothetical protein